MILLKSQSSFSARNRAPSSRGALPVKALARVLEYMHANLAADIGLKELATLAGYSPQHFKRAFKISKGLPPHQFLLVSREAWKRSAMDSRRPEKQVTIRAFTAFQTTSNDSRRRSRKQMTLHARSTLKGAAHF
jgi:AraC family transcriptional regulator